MLSENRFRRVLPTCGNFPFALDYRFQESGKKYLKHPKLTDHYTHTFCVLENFVVSLKYNVGVLCTITD